eukprot:jgi/Tetstr1/459070/TSEL_000406.t1
MLRIAVAYAHQRNWEGWVVTLSQTDEAEKATVHAAQLRLNKAMSERDAAELDLQGAALYELRMLFLKRRRGKTSQLMGVQIMGKARQRRLRRQGRGDVRPSARQRGSPYGRM